MTKTLITSFLLIICSACIYAQKTTNLIIDNKLELAERAEMNGYIGKKLDQSYENRILAQNVNNLIEPFRNRTETRLWQSEFWGKWFTSAVLAYRYRPEPELKAVIEKAVSDLIATQTKNGYIGNYARTSRLEQWDIWGMKYTLLGLLDYYDLTKKEKSLKAAIRLANYIINELRSQSILIVKTGNYRGMASSSILGAICRLYTYTHKDEYLEFAKEIVRQWETPVGPQLISKASVDVSKRFSKPKTWYSWEQGQKAYEMMSCYEGLLELYRITGNSVYKKAVETTWQNILDTEINIAGSGASAEMWFGGKDLQTNPIKHYQETCVTVTWMKLSLQLLKLTGKSKYADAVERSYYNALLGALSADGSDWAKYTPLNGQRLPGSGQCGMRMNCCTANGPRGQFALPLTAVMSTKDGFSINFFVDGFYKLKTPLGEQVKVIQETNYPVTGNIKIILNLDTKEEMAIRVRIPSWSKNSMIRINNEISSKVQSGKYVEVKRKWSSGDVITLNLDMRGRTKIRGNAHQFAAIMRGPIVLARDAQLPGPHLGTVNSPITHDGYIKLKFAGTNKNGFWMQYYATFIPESYKETPAQPIDILLSDYSSSGYGKEKSTFKVWLPQLYNPELH